MPGKRVGLLVVVVLVGTGLGSPAGAVSWDLLDESYGNGPGQISFKNSYTWQWGGVPAETLSFHTGAVLTGGGGSNYATRGDGTIGMPSSGVENWRVDVRLQLPAKMGASLYLSDNQASRWGSIITINHLYHETVAHPDTIGDYNRRVVDGGDIAPSGFDGAVAHTYSFRKAGGAVSLFVDDVSVGPITGGAGASQDGCELIIAFGAGMSSGPGTAYVYSVQIASDTTEVVEPISDVCYGCYDLASVNDLARFASHWLEADCAASSGSCGWADMDDSGQVDIGDYGAALGGGEPITLIDNGVCEVCIVSVGLPSTVADYTVSLLQDAFETAAGVRPTAGPVAGMKQIRVGLAEEFSSAGMCDYSFDQLYTLGRCGDNIDLVGNSTGAMLWAAMDFCEQVLRVSWPAYDSGPMLEGAVQSTVTAGHLCQRTAPDFVERGWGLTFGFDGPQYEQQIVDWMAQNRNNLKKTLPYQIREFVRDGLRARGIAPETNTHTFHWLVPCEQYFAAHPEYFPLIGGVRQCRDAGSVNMQLCVSNPDVAQIIADEARGLFAQYPELVYFGIGPNDGSLGWCECGECVAWDGAQAGTGWHSNRLLRLVNTVADSLAEEFPDKMFATLAYDTTREPPDIAAAPNVAIQLCTTGRNFLAKLTDPTDATNAPIMAQLQGWLDKAAHVALYDYYYYSGTEYCPSPIAQTICQEYPELLAAGLKGVSIETSPTHWPSLRLPAYAMARCSWDTSTDYANLLADYAAKMYGPAATHMMLYHLLYESTLREHVAVLTMSTSAYQLFPAALADVMATLQIYLDIAASVAAGGSASHVAAVQAEQDAFDAFKSIAIDPATIPGIGPNLVSNPGAESSSTDWTEQVLQGGTYYMNTPSGSGRTDSRAFKIQYAGGVTNKARWLHDDIPITPGKTYAGRLWVKANCAASYGRIAFYQASGEYDVFVSWQNSDSQWMQLVVPEFTAVNDTLYLSLEMYGQQAGDIVYFDDVFFAELP